MPGRARLPGGEQRKASQRRRKLGAPAAPTVLAPTWRPGDRVRWRKHVGQVLRETADGEAEIMIGTRTYSRGSRRAAVGVIAYSAAGSQCSPDLPHFLDSDSSGNQ